MDLKCEHPAGARHLESVASVSQPPWNSASEVEDRTWSELNEVRSDLAGGQLIHSCKIGSIRSRNELGKPGKLVCERITAHI